MPVISTFSPSLSFYYLQQLLSSNPPALIFRQLLPSNVSKFMIRTIADVGFIPLTYFSEHFHQEFPDLNLISWTDSFPARVIDRLRYLRNTARFKYCPTRQVCIDIATWCYYVLLVRAHRDIKLCRNYCRLSSNTIERFGQKCNCSYFINATDRTKRGSLLPSYY